jgi:predicted NUDIX family NTP pyrophosphohydrolase
LELSAGLLMFKKNPLRVLLVHPGGPYWTRKNKGFWSIPKGGVEDGEDTKTTAIREFTEETGFNVSGFLYDLGTTQQNPSKRVASWAFEGDCDPSKLKSNVFSMEWPKGSGKFEEFPEIDRAAWFELEEAYEYILQGQRALLDALKKSLK